MLKRIVLALALSAGAIGAAFGQASVFQQNQVMAGPTSGAGHAAPRFLVGGDLPNIFTKYLAEIGTTAPASASGNTVIAGTIATPTLTNTGQAFFYNTVADGANIQGDGSGNDFVVRNKGGTGVCAIATGSSIFNCLTLTLTNPLTIANGGTGSGTQQGALNAIMCSPTRAGDLAIWNGSNWTCFAGNNSGTQFLSENASGVPAWSAGSGVTSVTVAGTAGNIAVSGTCTITSTGTCTVDLAAARKTGITIQTFASGSGTYTTPANTLWIEISMVGGGGGGQGSGTTPGAAGAGGDTCWNTSGAACTSAVLKAAGGAAASGFNTGAAGGSTGGSTTCDVEQIAGGWGGMGSNVTNTTGGVGGSSPFYGGGGAGGSKAPQNGNPGVANTGGGGGGAGAAGTAGSGGGGGSGGYCRHIINSPAGSYTYAVGASGGGGTLGTSGAAGGAGAAGKIVVVEHYN